MPGRWVAPSRQDHDTAGHKVAGILSPVEPRAGEPRTRAVLLAFLYTEIHERRAPRYRLRCSLQTDRLEILGDTSVTITLMDAQFTAGNRHPRKLGCDHRQRIFFIVSPDDGLSAVGVGLA